MTKLQQHYKDKFLKRVKNLKTLAKGYNWSLPLEEYVEQESWRRPAKSNIDDCFKKQSQGSAPTLDEVPNNQRGILSDEEIFKTNLWYLTERR